LERTRVGKQLADFMRSYWASVPDRAADTQAARAAFQDKFLRDAGADAVRAEELRKAYYAELSILGVTARRRKAIPACGASFEGCAINARRAAKAIEIETTGPTE
jgi:hypothetical protein